MTTVAPSTDLRSTTRARYAPAGPTRNRPGSSSRRASLSSGSVAQSATMLARPAPSRTRSSDPSCASYGMPRPPPASTSRTVVPVAWASRRAARTVAATWATSAAASRTFEAPNACRPSSSRCGDVAARRAEAATRSAGIHPELAGPVVADEPDAFESRVLGHRGPQAGPAGAGRPSRRSPRAGRARRAIRRSRRGSRPSTAARSSSSRFPGPVITTRSGAMPARATVASSPPDATSAPSPSRPR